MNPNNLISFDTREGGRCASAMHDYHQQQENSVELQMLPQDMTLFMPPSAQTQLHPNTNAAFSQVPVSVVSSDLSSYLLPAAVVSGAAKRKANTAEVPLKKSNATKTLDGNSLVYSHMPSSHSSLSNSPGSKRKTPNHYPLVSARNQSTVTSSNSSKSHNNPLLSYSSSAVEPSITMSSSTTIPNFVFNNPSSSVATGRNHPTTYSHSSSSLLPTSVDPTNSTSSALDLALMTPAQRRRYQRNLREQGRSQKISQQIKDLMNALTDAQVPFKANKFSILTTVVDYVRQLQNKTKLLDDEYTRLIATMKETLKHKDKGGMLEEEEDDDDDDDDDEVVVQEVDPWLPTTMNYKRIFVDCPIALSVAALDGRVLAWNHAFQQLMGFTEEELAQQSLFNFLDRKDMDGLFRALGMMLKDADENQIKEDPNRSGGSGSSSPSSTQSPIPAAVNLCWNGSVISKVDPTKKIQMNITLARTTHGGPKFINCAATIA